VLDVRSPAEWQAGHLPGSLHRYLPDLVSGPPDPLAPGDEVWLACASGYRASIAAGLLERSGLRPIVLSAAGVADVLAVA
jgi:rhodanese-related sulfurtransferase